MLYLTRFFALLLGIAFFTTDLYAQYQFKRPWHYSYQRFKTDDGLWGISDYRKKDSVLVAPTYNFIESDVVWGKYAIVNKGGEESKYAPFAAGGKFGMITAQGKVVVPITYDWIDRAVTVKGGNTQIGYAENEFALHLGGDWGIISAEGRSLELSRNYCFIHAVVFKGKEEKYATRMFFYANEGGTLEGTETGSYRISGGTWYVINEGGDEVLSFTCQSAKAAPGGYISLKRNGKSGNYHPHTQEMDWK